LQKRAARYDPPRMGVKHFRIDDPESFDLSKIDPRDTSGGPSSKEEALEKGEAMHERIAELQEVLYAENKRKILIVLQGMDTSGKDGTVRHVMRGISPASVRVVSFKKPTEPELWHDYLWRIHPHVPGNGEIVIFNRSHYEDVLVVRVHELVPKDVWKKRYQQINDFERMLTENGVTIVKFFLHISPDEQRERLQARLDDPTKRWKFQHGDLDERKLWDEYQKAYQDAIRKTSTEWAPWTVVPADRKWFRNHVVAAAIIDTLEKLDCQYPQPDVSGEQVE
jgi:PPK2 family polyphosphate:nucleotide phosphotransferase